MTNSFAETYRSAVKILAPLNNKDMFATIISEAKKHVKAEYGSVFLADKDQNLHRVYTNVPQYRQLEPRPGGNTYTAFKTGKAIIASTKRLKQRHPQLDNKNIRFIAIIPLSHGKKTLGVITLQSIHSLKVNQKKKQVLQLFGSLAGLKIHNNALFEEVQNALQTRDLFISMASHELKTPMTTISAYSQLLKKHLDTGREIKKAWVDTLHTTSIRMSRIIAELFHVNQIKTGNLHFVFEKCDLEEVAIQALKEFHMLYPKHTIQFESLIENKNERIIKGDSEKLVQVVTNVLNNAAKFSETRKPITLRLSRNEEQTLLEIIDRGKGISKEDLAHLFQEFYKANGNTQEGLGLGLFISKKIMDAHKGKINISSTVGVGTTVSLVFCPIK